MTSPYPVTDECWPIDTGCDDSFDDLPPDVKTRASSLAVSTLRRLTLGRVGGCPKKVRPCSTRRWNAYFAVASTSTFSPFQDTLGQWINNWCGCANDCSCTPHSALVLPGHVGRVDQVKIDGVVLDPTTYRVDNYSELVRLGGIWPVEQDMGLADDAPGTFSVTYLDGRPVDQSGAWAAGVLASQFAKACQGKSCSLPTGVSQVVRNGATLTIESGAFPNGFTGIREVDAFISLYNPYGLKSRPSVWWPGMAETRVTTWP